MENMHMRFFNELFYIQNHYDNILTNAEMDGERNWSLLETWNIRPEDIEDIREERKVLSYLLACKLSIAREEKAVKPELAIVERLFNRQLMFLENVHGIHAYNANKHRNPMTRKKYKACRHYLFKFSLPAWVEKLPAEILTFDEKYGDLSEEALLPIPNS